jgi:hypothetical protein
LLTHQKKQVTAGVKNDEWSSFPGILSILYPCVQYIGISADVNSPKVDILQAAG